MDAKPIITCPDCGAQGSKETHRTDCPKAGGKRFTERWGGGTPRGPQPEGGKNPRKES